MLIVYVCVFFCPEQGEGDALPAGELPREKLSSDLDTCAASSSVCETREKEAWEGDCQEHASLESLCFSTEAEEHCEASSLV